MGNKNVKIEKNGNMMTLRYELVPGEVLDDVVLDRLRSNFIECVAPVQYSESGTYRAIYAQIPALTEMSLFVKRTLSKLEVLETLKNLVASLDIGKNGIPVSYIVKDPNFIFINEQTFQIHVFVIPVKGEVLDVSEIPTFIRNLLSNMRFREEDKDNYVARLLTALNADVFSLSSLNVLINEMLLEIGDSQLNNAPNVPTKVDRMSVMRNRAGARPGMGNGVPPMPQMGGQVPPMPQMGGQVPPMPQMGGQVPPMPQMGGQVPPMPQMGGQVPPMPQMGGQVPPMPQMGGQVPPMPQMGGQVPPMPQMGGQVPPVPQMVNEEPRKRFDPMTGKPIEDVPEEPAAEEPKAEEPAAAEEPKAEEPVVAEEPKAEEPVAAEELKAEEPVAAEEPKAEEPAIAEEPKAEEPAIAEEPKAEEPAIAEEPKAEEPAIAEEPKAEEPAAVEPQMPEQKKEEPRKRFDPMTGKPIEDVPEEPALEEASNMKPMSEKEEKPSEVPNIPLATPVGGQVPPVPGMVNGAPRKRFDPMTGKPIEDNPVEEKPVENNTLTGGQIPPRKRFDPMTGKPIEDNPVTEKPATPPVGPMSGQIPPMPPMGGQVPPMPPIGGQVPPVSPMRGNIPSTPPVGGQVPPVPGMVNGAPRRRFDPMTGKPIEDNPVETVPVEEPKPVQPEPVQSEPKMVNPMPAEPKMVNPAQPEPKMANPSQFEPKMVNNSPFEPKMVNSAQSEPIKVTPVSFAPQPKSYEEAIKEPELQELSLDDIEDTGMDNHSGDNNMHYDPITGQPIEPPKPHFVREKTGEKIFINKDEFKIGKSKIHTDYAIENNSAISRVHVVIINRNGVSYLKDNDSTNGTYLDGEKIMPGREILLKSGMKIKFGDEDFTFLLREGD